MKKKIETNEEKNGKEINNLKNQIKEYKDILEEKETDSNKLENYIEENNVFYINISL